MKTLLSLSIFICTFYSISFASDMLGEPPSGDTPVVDISGGDTVNNPGTQPENTGGNPDADAASGGTVTNYSNTNTSSTSNACTPMKVGEVFLNPSTGKVVDENCNEITVSNTSTPSSESTQTNSNSTTTNTSTTTQNTSFQDLNSKTTTTQNTTQTVTQTTSQVTGWDVQEKPAGVHSQNGLNPVNVSGETSSTSTISKSGQLDTKEELKKAQLKEAVIKGFFTINDEIIQVDPSIDSMSSIIDKINASKSYISAKYNVDLDRVEISSSDIDSIIKLGSWGDTSNFLGAVSLIPSEKIGQLEFIDVKKEDWSYKYIATLSAMNIVKGKEKTYFGSEDSISRLEALKIILEATKSSMKTSKTCTIKDVPNTHWGYKYICAGIENKIITLSGLGIFNPNVPISRAEMLEWMMKAKKIEISTSLKANFSDVSVTSKYYYIIGNAQSRGIISGYADGTFKPSFSITRKEFSKIIYNVLSIKL